MGGDKQDVDGGRLPTVDKKLVVWALICFAIGSAGIALAIVGTVPVSDGVSLQSPDGMNATLTGATEAHLEEPFPTSGTVEWTTEAGNISFFSTGPAAATVHKDDIEGTWTRISAITADPNTITIDPADKSSAVVGQEIDTFEYRQGIAIDDGTNDFSYEASGPARVTVQGISANTQVAAVDASSGQVLDVATSSGGGAVTFDALDSGSHVATIQSFTPNAPTFSDATPTGGTSSPPTQVSVNVSDADFPRGDSVGLSIAVDGSEVSTASIASNQTVTASVPQSARTGGGHTWTINASDSYGEWTNATYEYTVPKNLTIHNEETGELIDGQQVDLTVYTQGDNQQIYNFSTNDGSVDLGSGFPVTEPFIVVAESPGYLDRRIYVNDVYETQKLYLLNESLAHTDVIFRIEDYTGSYPPDNTVLEVQRGINNSWQTVLGDTFGANDQFVSQLRYNTRHRMILRNIETGDSRLLGSYTPLTSTEETISVSPTGDLTLPDTHPRVEIKPGARTLPAKNGVTIESAIRNGTLSLSEWNVSVYHISGSGTNTTLYTNESTSATGGSVNPTVNLDSRDGQVKVVTRYGVGTGATGSQVAMYNVQSDPDTSMALLDGIVGMIGLVPGSDADMVRAMTAMILTIVGTAAVGSVFRMSTESMGLVTMSLVAGFAILGWVDYSLLFTIVVLFASLSFLRRRY